MNKIEKLSEAISNIKDIDTLNSLQRDINNLCENRRKYLNVVKESKKYNDSTFMFIKESFENLSPSLFKTKEGREIIKKYIKEHKECSDLQKMFIVCEQLKKVNNEIDGVMFINEVINTVGEINRKTLDEKSNNLKKLFQEAYVLVGEDSKTMLSENTDKLLDESLKYVLTNKKNLKNISKYSECINEISKYIKEKPKYNIPIVENNTTPDLESLIETINKKYSSENIGEENAKILKEIYSSNNKEGLFEQYKEKCLEIIDKAIDSDKEQSVCDKLYEFKEKINGKTFNEKTLPTDISNFIGLGEMIEDSNE